MCDPSATLSGVLEWLRREHAAFLEAVVDGQYSFWIGSGISRGVLPGVSELIKELLSKLHGGSEDPRDPSCPYVGTIREALAIIGRDWDLHDGRSPEEWEDLDQIADGLSGHYARVLGLRVPLPDGEFTSALAFLEIPERYSAPDLEPDAEHRLIAALTFEGAIAKLLTTNWDPLVERAARRMRDDGDPGFSVVAHADEINGMGDRFLLKIHGCAELAHRDSARYGPYLIATRVAINGWGRPGGAFGHTVPFKGQATALLRQHLTLFIGLSGVDDNILGVASETPIGRDEPYRPSPPKVAFVTDRLSDVHLDILRQLHDEESREFVDVQRHATIEPCAKPLLAGFFVHLLRSKAEAIALRAAQDPTFPVHLRELLEQTIELGESHLARTYDPVTDPDERWRRFAAEVPAWLARFIILFRAQVWPQSDSSYEPLSPHPPAEMRQPAGGAQQELYWLLLTIGALTIGHRTGKWRIGPPDDGHRCHLVLERPQGQVRVFLMPDSSRSRLLLESSFPEVVSQVPTLLIYTHEREPKRRPELRRLTRTAPGVDPSSDTGEIWIADLVSDSTDVESFLEGLYLELAGEAA